MKNINGKIYKIINLLINEPCYIGQTTNSIESRFCEHCSLSNHQNTSYLINTYGRQYFKIEVIQDNINTKEELDKIEKEYIISYLQQYDLINKVIYQYYEKHSITIQCIETQEIFPSINIAAQKYNININSISQAIQYGYATNIKQSKINNSNENNNKNSDNSDNNKSLYSQSEVVKLHSQSEIIKLHSRGEVVKLHWKKLNENKQYQKRIQNEYIIYIIEQKFNNDNNSNNSNSNNTNDNDDNKKSTDQIISTSQKFKSNAFCIQCIETLEIFSSMTKAAKQYNINTNLISKSIKYGYTAGIDKKNNKLHWKQITNDQYSNIINTQEYNDSQYIWKPIYVQQTWKKIWKNQLEFHKNNENSLLYKLLNNNDIDNFRIIPVYESTLQIIKDNIKKFVNIKSLNDAIEKEKQLISLLISNSYQLYNFYKNLNYNINNNKQIANITNIHDLFSLQYEQQKKLEQELLYNNQEINIQYKPMQIQCIETKEIFNDIYTAANKYNIPMCNLNKALVHGYAAGKIDKQNNNLLNKTIELHWKEYKNINLKKDTWYQLYIIEQKMSNVNIYKNPIIIQCLETNEIFNNINQAAQKYNTTNFLLYAAIRYGHTAGTDQQGNKLHWINKNYPIYKIKYDDNNIWLPICIVCEHKFTNTYKQNNIELLTKLKYDINCCIYNLLNQYPLENFRVAKAYKYKFVLNNIVTNDKKSYTIPIQCIETGEIFNSINQAVKKYKINANNIKFLIQNNQPTGKDINGNKLHWKLIEENNQNDQNDIYSYFINQFQNININNIFEQAYCNLSKYYNLYGQQLTAQNLISNKIFKNIDIIAWNLIKNNPYLDTSELCKSINDDIIFLNYQSAAQYYNIFLQKMKNIINNNEEFIYNKVKQKIINISVNELKDNIVIYAIAYQIIKIIISNNITYAITYNSFNKFKMQLENEKRLGMGQLINNTNNYQCMVIKSHIYFKEEAEDLKNKLLNRKANIFRCKLPVRCITTGEEFSSIEEASKKYGYKSETNILYVCRGQREYTIDKKTEEKLKWEFLQEEKDYIPMDRNQKKYTVFLLYYNNDLIIISKSILFKNKQLSLYNKRLILNKLKTNNTAFKLFCNNIKIANFKFVIHADNLSFEEAQIEINNLKLQYISNNTLLIKN